MTVASISLLICEGSRAEFYLGSYHRLFKLVVFRFVNLMSLFIIRYFADVPFHPCMATRVANQVVFFCYHRLCACLQN